MADPWDPETVSEQCVAGFASTVAVLVAVSVWWDPTAGQKGHMN